MQDEQKRMLELLRLAAEAVDFCMAGEVVFDRDRSAFRIGGSRVEVAWAPQAKASEMWRIREYYEVADYKKGGFRPQVTVLATGGKGMEAVIAKTAVLKIMEALVDLQFDEHASAGV
jgi:hypothetical protein